MKKFLLPLLSLAMVFVLSCTSDLKMISEDTLSQPLVTSELADVTFSQNFTIRSSGSTSFIIDPGTKTITRYSFEVYFDETNISENGNSYLSAVVAETTYTNGYQVYLSPSQDAVDLFSRTTVKCYFKIWYDDNTKYTEYSFDVVLNEDTPRFNSNTPVIIQNDTLPENFTQEDFVLMQFELDAGEFEEYIDTSSFTVMGISNRLLTHYSIVRSEDPDSLNWYTVTLQPSARAVLLTDEYSITPYIQLLYTDATGAAYTVDSYTCSVYMPADVYTPYFVGGVSSIIFAEDYMAGDEVMISMTLWDQNTDLYIADVQPFDDRGYAMRDGTGYLYSYYCEGRPTATNGSSRSVSGNNVTLYTTFTANFDASVYPDGFNEQVELKVVYDDDLYAVDGTEGYVSTFTTLTMPGSRGTAIPSISCSVSTINIKSDFQEGPIGGYTANMGTEYSSYSSFEEYLEGTVAAGTYSFTETTTAFTLVSDIWVGTISSEDFWLDISGPNKSWIDETKTVFSDTPTYSQSMAFTYTIQPSEEAVDYYQQNYNSWEDYAEFPMDTGNVVIYIKCGYNKQYDDEGNFLYYKDTITCSRRTTPLFLPPTPEGLVSINSTETYPNSYFFCPEDEVDADGRVAFTWYEALELCANKERHPMLPWDYELAPLYQMRAITYRKYADFYDFANGTSTLSCGTGNSDEYWTSTEAYSDYGFLARVLQATKNYTNQYRSKDNTYRVRCVILKYDRTFYDAEVPDIFE